MTARQLSKLSALLNRVRLATEPYGKKSELARFLGEPPQRINDWLFGGRSPGGEVTLLMLEWVSAEEVNKPKTLGDASNITKGKTRKLNPLSHEKSKQVRKRK